MKGRVTGNRKKRVTDKVTGRKSQKGRVREKNGEGGVSLFMKAQYLVKPECYFELQGSIRDIGMLLLVARALLLNCPASI